MDEEYGGFDEGMNEVTDLDTGGPGPEADDVGAWMDEVPEAEVQELSAPEELAGDGDLDIAALMDEVPEAEEVPETEEVPEVEEVPEAEEIPEAEEVPEAEEADLPLPGEQEMVEELLEDDTLEDSWDTQPESAGEGELSENADAAQEDGGVSAADLEGEIPAQGTEPGEFVPPPPVQELPSPEDTEQEHADAADASADTEDSLDGLAEAPVSPGGPETPSEPNDPSNPPDPGQPEDMPGPDNPAGPEGELDGASPSAMEQMAEYLSSHNYGREDFAAYCQDPEWQRINNQLLLEQEVPSTAAEQMSLYMAEHNYSRMDYPTYSQDPEWQRLNEAYQQDPEMRIPVTPYEERIDAVLPSDSGGQPSPEYGESVPQNADAADTLGPLEEIADAPDAPGLPEQENIDAADVPGSPEEITDAADVPGSPEEITDAADVAGPLEELTDVPDTPGLPEQENIDASDAPGPLEEITDAPDAPGLPEQENIDASDAPGPPEEITDAPDVAGQPEQELVEPAIVPADLQEEPGDVPVQNAEGFYEQGDNAFGFEGTCGPTSVANSMNRLLGENRFTENDVLTQAVQENLCFCESDDPLECGGTTTEQFVQLYERMGELSGENIQVETYEFGDVLSMEEVAQKLDEGCAVNVAVDAATLWGEDVGNAMGTPPVQRSTDHWITVTKAERGEDGAITGFEVIDSGGGVSYVDAATYQRMCYGDEQLHLTDPTCIVARREAAETAPVPETAEGIRQGAAAGAGDLPPDTGPPGGGAPSLRESSELFAAMDAETLARSQAAMEKLDPGEQAVYLQALRAEPSITQDVCRVSETAGGQTAGLENRVKLPDSLAEKLHERGEPVDIAEVSDILRYTQTFPPETLTQGVQDSLALYEQKGYEIVQVRNAWQDDTNPYNGINVRLISPDRQKLEVQFHTPESYEVKNGPMHRLYEEWRRLPEDSDEAITLQNQMFALSRRITAPRNISEVKST